MRRSTRATTRRIVFSAVVFFGFFGLLEGSLQLVLPAIASQTMANHDVETHINADGFVYDPDLFWYWQELPNAMQDEHGFRTHKSAVTIPKPEGLKRAITFGDSQTLGPGLSWDETWPEVANQDAGAAWEVLNAAVPGYRSLNVYRLLRKKMLYYQPDAIIVDCMPFDSPRETFHEMTSLSERRSLTVVERFQAVIWESYTWFMLRRGLEVLMPRKYRWLDEASKNQLESQDGAGNHDLILQWADHHGIATLFTEYPVWDEKNDRLRCFTLPGDLPEGAVVVPVCDTLAASGLSMDELFFDSNHLRPPGTAMMGRAVADALLALP